MLKSLSDEGQRKRPYQEKRNPGGILAHALKVFKKRGKEKKAKTRIAGMSSKFGGKPLRAALAKKYGSDSDQVRDFDETAKEFKLK